MLSLNSLEQKIIKIKRIAVLEPTINFLVDHAHLATTFLSLEMDSLTTILMHSFVFAIKCEQ